MSRPEPRLAEWLASLLPGFVGRALGVSADAAARATAVAVAGPPRDTGRLLPPDLATVQLAARNGAGGLLWSALSQAERLPALATDVRDALRDARDRDAALGMDNAVTAHRLVEGLLRAGVPVIALKGLALRATLYAPLGLARAPGDIDLMVRREQLPAAQAVLAQQGYVPVGKLPAEAYAHHQHIEPFHLPNNPSIVVDVHWTPLHPRSPYHVDPEQWWEAAVPLAGGPEGLQRLGDLDLALQYALQIDFADAYGGRGRALFDLAAWILASGISLQQLHGRASAGGARAVVPRVATVGDRVFGTALARAVALRATPRGLLGWAWRRTACTALWIPLQEGRIPTWYIHYCARALGRAPNLLAATRAVLKPVLTNPRLGGRGV